MRARSHRNSSASLFSPGLVAEFQFRIAGPERDPRRGRDDGEGIGATGRKRDEVRRGAERGCAVSNDQFCSVVKFVKGFLVVKL